MSDAAPAARPIPRPLSVTRVSRVDYLLTWLFTPTGQECGVLVMVSVLAALVYFLPFIIHMPSTNGIPFAGSGMEKVYGMWDGPIFVTTAAALWTLNPSPYYRWLGEPPSYYAERFPAYPLLVHWLSPVFGYWNSGLIINVVASTGLTLVVYFFIKRLGYFSTHPYLATWSPAFWIALISIFWPPRGFMYRYVIGSDPLFFVGFLGAVYFFKTRRYGWAAAFGTLAVLSRPNSFMAVIGLGVLALGRLFTLPDRERWRELADMLPLLLMPIALVGIFVWDQLYYGDWLIWYGPVASMVHPESVFYPALQFYGIGEEGVPYMFLIVLAGIFELIRRRHYDYAFLSLLFYVPAIFVGTDVSRYLLPAFPFAVYLAGERILASVPVRLALILCIPLIFLYGWDTMLNGYYQAPFQSLYSILH